MHVCRTLSHPNDSGFQTCLEWVEQSSTSFLPSITKQDADSLLMDIVPCLVVVFIVRRILSMLR